MRDVGEDPSGVCYNHSANAFPVAILKDKERAVGVQGRTVLGEMLLKSRNWHLVTRAYF
jgi:hypothetical protein